MGLNKLLSIGFVIALSGTVAYGQFASPWTHVCRDNFCKKVEKESVVAPEEGNSQAVCKLKCASDGNLWPLPTNITKFRKTTTPFLLANLALTISAGDHQTWLTAISTLFRNNLNAMNQENVSPSKVRAVEDNRVTVAFEIAASSHDLGLNTDESYELAVSFTTADPAVNVQVLIKAPTYFGARHGLETLSQLVAYDEENDYYQILNDVEIKDKPVFSYRGVHIDVSRNFMPLPTLRKLIDGMSYNKLNIFHIHLTDTHSFPLESTLEPKLTQYGAYSPGKVYKKDDLNALVEYAKIRGIKIVAEFDAPAHVGNGWQWGESAGVGKLVVCENAEPWYDFCVEPPCGQLNIANPNMYNVLEKVYREYMEIFDKDLFHMGGDEVHLDCYNTSTEIISYLEQKQWGRDEVGFIKLWDEFQTKAYDLALETSANENLQAILWTSLLTSQEYVREYLPKEKYIMQLWGASNDSIIPFLLDNGYRTIFTNADALYLDCGYPEWAGPGYNWCSPYKGWQTIYDHSPQKIYAKTAGEEKAQAAVDSKQILGGATAMWSEQVDEDAVEGKVFPRVAALAERLWTNPTTTWLEAERRMVDNRRRLKERGINADTLQPEWCFQNEGQCHGEPEEEEQTTTEQGEGRTTTEGGGASLTFTPMSIAVGLIFIVNLLVNSF